MREKWTSHGTTPRCKNLSEICTDLFRVYLIAKSSSFNSQEFVDASRKVWETKNALQVSNDTISEERTLFWLAYMCKKLCSLGYAFWENTTRRNSSRFFTEILALSTLVKSLRKCAKMMVNWRISSRFRSLWTNFEYTHIKNGEENLAKWFYRSKVWRIWS